MKYYIRDNRTKNKLWAVCPKLNKKRKVCRCDDFELSEDQWLIENDATKFQNVRLVCKECGQTHIRAFDIKSFSEQFNKENLLKMRVS
jgi:hypothetical protein